MSWTSGVLRWLLTGLVIYVLVVVVVALVQRRMIYFPSLGSEESVLAAGAQAGFQPWRDDSGDLVGFHRPPRRPPPQPDAGPGAGEHAEPFPPVLVLHGNAGFAAHRGYLAQLFPHRSVYVLEYPGFGARRGSPGEPSIRAAAESALKDLAVTRAHGPVLLLGESIGSGPASWLAGAYPDLVAGVVLFTPFENLAQVARAQMPILPVRLLLRDRWENGRHLESFPGPVAILVAAEDRLVPARFGRGLYQQYPGVARLWTIPEADHNTIMTELTRETWRDVLRFLEEPRN